MDERRTYRCRQECNRCQIGGYRQVAGLHHRAAVGCLVHEKPACQLRHHRRLADGAGAGEHESAGDCRQAGPRGAEKGRRFVQRPLRLTVTAMSALEMVATVARERFTTAELALRLEQAWRIFNLNQDLILAADQKIYVLFVMLTLLVAYVSTNLEKIMRQGALQRGILILFLMAVAAFFFFALSTVVSRSRKPPSAVSTLPRLVFFCDIAERESGPGYAEALCSTDLPAIFDDICHPN